jgi:hypothetical protein
MINELERMWKEEVLADVPARDLRGSTEGSHEKPQSKYRYLGRFVAAAKPLTGIEPRIVQTTA